jgi:hypothetical protein
LAPEETEKSTKKRGETQQQSDQTTLLET